MKIKKFNENFFSKDPQVGDFVICYDDTIEDIQDFLLGTIGQIANIYKKNSPEFEYLGKLVNLLEHHNKEELNKYPYFVVYENIPKFIPDYFDYDDDIKGRIFAKNEILYFCKNKEDLEMYINANKYNL